MTAHLRHRLARHGRRRLTVLGVPPTVLVLVRRARWSCCSGRSLPGLFTSQDPVNGVPADKLLGPSAAHWFGTDHLGRDLFSRVVHGTASSVASALVAVDDRRRRRRR